jgi:nucleoside-diphosphate-sugar epimerase
MDFAQIINSDNNEICSDENIPWDRFHGTAVLVTGATGVIGSAVVRALAYASKTRSLDINIIAVARDSSKVIVLGDAGYEFLSLDLRNPLIINNDIDYIIHCAGIRRSKDLVSKPVDVIETSVLSTLNLLNHAKDRHIKGMVFVSSMEVYGETSPKLLNVTESDLGYVDLENVRSCYPESRRMCENICNSFHAQYDIPVNSARLSQTFGAGQSFDDPIAAIQFGKEAFSGNDIILHTEGRSMSNFCYISDAVRALLTVLTKGESGTSYNVANPDASLSIRRFAETIAHKVCDDKIRVKIEVPEDIKKLGYAKDSRAVLNVDKLLSLGWKPAFGIEDMYNRLFAYWREMNQGIKIL